VVAGVHFGLCRVEQFARRVEIREPLRQVDGAVGPCHPGHFADDGFSEGAGAAGGGWHDINGTVATLVFNDGTVEPGSVLFFNTLPGLTPGVGRVVLDEPRLVAGSSGGLAPPSKPEKPQTSHEHVRAKLPLCRAHGAPQAERDP
jgi:hypothetical protein